MSLVPVSQCHVLPLVYRDVPADDDGPARREGLCPLCSAICWTLITGPDVDVDALLAGGQLLALLGVEGKPCEPVTCDPPEPFVISYIVPPHEHTPGPLLTALPIYPEESN